MDQSDEVYDDEPYDQDDETSQEAEPPRVCSTCGRQIDDAFFVLSNHVLCPSCREVLASGKFGSSRPVRFFKALFFGTIGGVAGAALYYAILKASNFHLGLIAIIVGFMVGAAVRKGSEGRGGFVYQAMAVFLTYSAIAATNIPLIIQAFQQIQAQEAADPVKAKQAAERKAAAKQEAAKLMKEPLPIAIGKTFLSLALLVFLLVVLVYASPVLHALNGGAVFFVILAFGLWEAWKINRRVVLPIEGPYSDGGAADPVPA